jgi:hypothetical protein
MKVIEELLIGTLVVLSAFVGWHIRVAIMALLLLVGMSAILWLIGHIVMWFIR